MSKKKKMPREKRKHDNTGWVDGERVLSHYVCEKCGMHYLILGAHECDIALVKRIKRAVLRRKKHEL